MLKKIWISLAITLIAAMVMSSFALAADQGSSSVIRAGSRIGQVKTVSKDRFTLFNGGVEKTILVNSSTRFVKINGDAKAFKNLATGQWAIAFGNLNERRELAAQIVLISPRKLNLGDWGNARQYGRVLSVDAKGSTLRVSTSSGFFTFTVDENTHFPGRVKSLSSLKAGMTVFASYRSSGGKLVVKSLIAFP
jgi:hypothetical protein